jgi:type IV pilus assembly protein PilE
MLNMPDAQRPSRGFTLIECLIALTIVGILAAIAYPSFVEHVRKSRRTEALLVFTEIQAAQARWRGNHFRYAGSLDELGLAGTSLPRADARYRFSVGQGSTVGYVIHAEALGAQALDRPCTHLRLTVSRHELRYESGTSQALGNGAADNQRCWSL